MDKKVLDQEEFEILCQRHLDDDLTQQESQYFFQQLKQSSNYNDMYLQLCRQHAIFSQFFNKEAHEKNHSREKQSINLTRYLDEDLNPSELKTFQQALTQNQKLAESLLLASHRELQWREHLKQGSTPQITSHRPIFRFALLAAGLLLAILTVFYILNDKTSKPKYQVLQLIKLDGHAKWENHSPRVGQYFDRETLYHLVEGQAELRYDDGTKIQLTSPAKWHYIQSASEKTFCLEMGSLTSSISKQSPETPFVFSNPYFETKIVGTSIALSATNEKASLNVIEGTVQVQHHYESQSSFIQAGQAYQVDPSQGFYWKGEHYHSTPIGPLPLIQGHKVAQFKKGVEAIVKPGLLEDAVSVKTEKLIQAEQGSQASLFFKISNKPQQPLGIMFRVRGQDSRKTYEVRVHGTKAHKDIMLIDDHQNWKSHQLIWDDFPKQWLASDQNQFNPESINLVSFVFRDKLNLSIKDLRLIYKK